MPPPPPAGGARRGGAAELIRARGRGGMGAVFAARKVGSTREVALKVLLEGGLRDPEALERFRREALATARLSHPNVVGIEDYGFEGAHPFIVMKLVEGPSLKEVLRTGPLEPQRAGEYALCLAEALAHAHERGVLHRDLKPDNVLISDGEPRLTDFGLAKLRGGEARERLTRTGDVVGTPCYMAPEQTGANSEQPVDERTDVYALGATLYEMLAGRPPFLGVSLMAVLTDVATRPPDPLEQVRPGVDPALAAVCHRCLEKEPAQRFPDAGAVAAALRAALQGGSPQEAAPAPTGSPRVVLVGALAGLGLSAAALGVAWVALRPAAAPPPAPAPRPDRPAVRAAPTPGEAPVETATVAERLARGPTPRQREQLQAQWRRLCQRVGDVVVGLVADQDVAFFEDLQEDLPFLGFPHVLRAIALYRLDRVEEALAALDAAEAAEVPYAGFFVDAFRGRWRHEQGDLAGAVEPLRRAWDAPETTLLALLGEQADVAERPFTDLSARSLWGEVAALLLDALRRTDRAQEGATLVPQVVERLPEGAWQAYERAASCLAAVGRAEDAADLCEQAYQRSDRLRVEPLTTLGRIFTAEGRLDQARVILAQARADASAKHGLGHPDIYLARAELLQRAVEEDDDTAGSVGRALKTAHEAQLGLNAWATAEFDLALLPPPLFEHKERDRERRDRRQRAAQRAHQLRLLALFVWGNTEAGRAPRDLLPLVEAAVAQEGLLLADAPEVTALRARLAAGQR